MALTAPVKRNVWQEAEALRGRESTPRGIHAAGDEAGCASPWSEARAIGFEAERYLASLSPRRAVERRKSFLESPLARILPSGRNGWRETLKQVERGTPATE